MYPTIALTRGNCDGQFHNPIPSGPLESRIRLGCANLFVGCSEVVGCWSFWEGGGVLLKDGGTKWLPPIGGAKLQIRQIRHSCSRGPSVNTSVRRFATSCSPGMEPLGFVLILPFVAILSFGPGMKNVRK